MADEAELRARLDLQREQLDDTIDQIGERVVPGRVVRRKRAQFRNRLTDLRDRVMGNDEADYPGDAYYYGGREDAGRYDVGRYDDGHHYGERMSEAGDRVREQASMAADRVREQASSAAETVSHAPEALRRQTRGNPMAAGLIAFGGGLLAAALIPETRREQQVARRMQPELESATSALAATGREMAEEMREPAEDAMEAVKESARGGSSG
jgi:sRNA-binding protein